jgi:hypothetical protein
MMEVDIGVMKPQTKERMKAKVCQEPQEAMKR